MTSTVRHYQELKNQEPIMEDCFFAFSNEQFKKGIEKHNLKDKKILNGGMGLYGTMEGIEKFMKFYDDISTRIGKECNPQDVYDYEFDNHECSITMDDTQVMELLKSYFGEDVKVKRKYRAWCTN
jgi:hypothetical protein